MTAQPARTALTALSALSPAAARRVFLLLSFTRWFPVGLIIGFTTLLPLERGLTIAQALTASSLGSFVVFALELPTSGFADSIGRRPVFLVSAAVNVAASTVFVLAHSFAMFALAAVLTGVFRALDSGPLEAWYVDTARAADPAVDVGPALSIQGVVLGGALAAGALLSGGLIWWHPWASQSALLLPAVLWVGLNVVHLVVSAVLLKEPARPESSTGVLRTVRQAGTVVRGGLSLLRSNRVLRGLVLVEVFWATGMVVFETFQPIRLTELLGSESGAGAVNGPSAAAGWAVFAVGSALGGWLARRVGTARAAMVARVLNGLGAAAMGLMAGPVALIGMYLFTYSMHGAAGPQHSTLLHREASENNRTTVLSMNSMMSFLAYSIAAVVLGLLADTSSTQLAMVVGGSVSVLGVFCYLPARRAERARAAAAQTRGAPQPSAAQQL